MNQAAKRAGVAKSTLLERLNTEDLNRKMSATRNERGHWQIDEAELFRCFPRDQEEPQEEPQSGTVRRPSQEPQKTSQNNALEVEVATLREQLRSAGVEKGYLEEQIKDLRARAERAEDKEDELRRRLPPPTEATGAAQYVTEVGQGTKTPAPARQGFWARLTRKRA